MQDNGHKGIDFSRFENLLCYLVDGNLQKCVWYANLRMGQASYANLRIVRISWHVLDSADEKGSFKFNDNKK